MLFRSQNGNILIDCTSVRIAKIRDKETQQIKMFNVVGTMITGRDVTLGRYSTEEAAKAALDKIYLKLTQEYGYVIDMYQL
jgi:hypothetical protein